MEGKTMQKIHRIDLGGVNCYLVHNENGYFLIDSGYPEKEKALIKALEKYGCMPGDLKLVVLTHGDTDHAGTCAALREKYGVPVMLHGDDLGMVEKGDITWNRKEKPDIYAGIFRLMSVLTIFVKAGEFRTFTPDIIIDDGLDLDAYGLRAKIIPTPGHSKGSISILTGRNDLICGDLIYNFFGIPSLYAIDDRGDFEKSYGILKDMEIVTVYPGHGRPFAFDKFVYKR